MLSNELFSEVMGLYGGVRAISNNKIIYWFDAMGEVRESFINIYELENKCKEWALIKGYEINESYNFIELERISDCYIAYQAKNEL